MECFCVSLSVYRPLTTPWKGFDRDKEGCKIIAFPRSRVEGASARELEPVGQQVSAKPSVLSRLGEERRGASHPSENLQSLWNPYFLCSDCEDSVGKTEIKCQAVSTRLLRLLMGKWALLYCILFASTEGDLGKGLA